MELLSAYLTAFADFIWGIPMIVVLIGLGSYLTYHFRFYYLIKMPFHFRNTYGKMFQKGEGEGSVSSFAAACTAMANTIGVGNISGVATAVTMGGPGAVFWMWVAGLLGMSIKACEIILGQRYRVKYDKSIDEYLCDRSFVMRNAFGWRKGATLLAIFVFTLGPWTDAVQTQAVTTSLQEVFGIDPFMTAAVIAITCLVTIAGGLHSISSAMEKVVPFMALVYVLAGIGIIILNITVVPDALCLIVKSAFTPAAGAGGFAGASVRDAMRYGISRGLYSNDAGTGYGIVAHASAQTDHPVRQSSWGWGEVFLDTIIICSITALSIILTGSYTTNPGITGAQLTTISFSAVYGPMGGYFLSCALAVFAWTTIVGMYYSCSKSVNYAFGDTKWNKRFTPVYMIYFLLPAVAFYDVEADALWAATDILTAAYVLITIIFIVGRHKEIFRLFDDFWDRFIPALERGEHPQRVSYEQSKFME